MIFRTLDESGRESGTVEIPNPTRSRKWGFGYCTTPDGTGPYGIHAPTRPQHTGTIRQVREAIAANRALSSFVSGGTCHTRRWFHDGIALDTKDVREWLDELDFAEYERAMR